MCVVIAQPARDERQTFVIAWPDPASVFTAHFQRLILFRHDRSQCDHVLTRLQGSLDLDLVAFPHAFEIFKHATVNVLMTFEPVLPGAPTSALVFNQPAARQLGTSHSLTCCPACSTTLQPMVTIGASRLIAGMSNRTGIAGARYPCGVGEFTIGG